MADKTKFLEAVKTGYTFKGESYKIGCAVLDGEVVSGCGCIDPFKNNEPSWIDRRSDRYW